MKLSTARKAWLLSFVSPEKAVALMFTARRVCINGQTKRYGFDDGSVLESTNGVWKVVKKNPKLEAAVKRFGAPTKHFQRGVEALLEQDLRAIMEKELPSPEDLLKRKVDALQDLLNEKDEQFDKATRPMVVRLDWWLVGLAGLVFLANALGYM